MGALFHAAQGECGGVMASDSLIWDGRVRWGGAAPVTVRIEALGEAG